MVEASRRPALFVERYKLVLIDWKGVLRIVRAHECQLVNDGGGAVTVAKLRITSLATRARDRL